MLAKIHLPSTKTIWYFSLFISIIIVILVFLLQQQKIGVDYPLGWDQPHYIYHTNRIIENGILNWFFALRAFDFYIVFIAYSGLIVQSVETSLILIEVIQSSILVILFSIFALKISHSYLFASITAILYPFLNNSINLFILPRQSFALILILSMILMLKHVFNPLKLSSPKTWFYFGTIFLLFLINITSAVFFSFFLIFLCIINRDKTLIKNSIVLLSFGSITTFAIFFLAFGNYDYPVTYWIPQNPSFNYYFTELILRNGGTVLLTIASLAGFILLLYHWKLKPSFYSLTAILWASTSLIFFHISILLSSSVEMWYVYADRSLLLFPVQLTVPFTLIFLGIKVNDLLGVVKHHKK